MAALELDDGPLALGGVVAALRVAPRDARVGPVPAIRGECVAARRVKPPLVEGACSVHVVEHGMVVAVVVEVHEGILGACGAQVGEEQGVVLDVCVRILPVRASGQLDIRARYAVPRAPESDDRPVGENDGGEVRIRALVALEDLNG
eukprot:CAMPEP_0119529944 /NCGR_PEP_ID=MMETSP1344-20130328/43854_1 /TAXON_ID=236787 /ORGANISM="Florenciella parvula, Strain CCMP2471" /LENGTH=146 /DNA_ID=CAMNT_0007569703 /DNA_START=54 /DNA_END=491 /DNA_ORIENTATION=-